MPVRLKDRVETETPFLKHSNEIAASFNHRIIGGIKIGLGIVHLQTFQRISHGFCHHQVAMPFAIRRNDKPRSVIRVGLVDHIFIGLHEFIPSCTILQISGIEFPVLIRPVDTLLEAGPLLVLADIQKKLQNKRALVRQHFLEVDDVLIAFLPNCFRIDASNPHGNDVFVVTAIENDNFSPARQFLVNPPEIIVA